MKKCLIRKGDIIMDKDFKSENTIMFKKKKKNNLTSSGDFLDYA